MSYPPQGPSNPSQDYWRQVTAQGHTGSSPVPQAAITGAHSVPGGGAPAPKPKRTGLIVGSIVGGLVLVIGIVTSIVILNSGEETIAVGDCLGADRAADDAEVFKAECGTDESTWRVLKVLDYDLPDAELDHFSTEKYPGNWAVKKKDGKTYCSVLDVQIGDCLTKFVDGYSPVKQKCTAPGAENRVVKVRKVAERDECLESDGWYMSSVPPQTICFRPA